MSDSSSKTQGIKGVLEQIDSEILTIQKELTQNELKVSKVEETERNLKLDLEGFELKIRGSFNAHNNMVRMLNKKLNEISDSQVELAQTLLNISEKVKEMEQMIG